MDQLSRENFDRLATRRFVAILCAGVLLLAGCARNADWPPRPRNKEEQIMIEAALRAIRQFDGWTEVACIVEKSGAAWRVQAWKIVHPQARGRRKCVPWAVRSITLDSAAVVTGYRNTL